MSRLMVASVGILCVIFSGCQFYKSKVSQDMDAITMRTISYNRVMSDVISTRCLGCHNPEFATYDGVRRNIEAIKQRALIDRDMPKGGSLSDYERKVLATWIDAGMPMNAGETPEPVPSPAPSPPTPSPTSTAKPTLEATFPSIRDNVFTPRCSHCHTSGGSAEGVEIFDWATLTGKDGWVTPYQPAKSELFHDITSTSKDRMPPPKAGPPLSSQEIDVINTWILNGAPKEGYGGPALTPTFTSIRDTIFTPRCATCHKPGGSADDVDIFNWKTLTGPNRWVVPSNLDDSELYQDIINTGKSRMPPLKVGAGLTQEQIDVIKTWILDGAKE